MKNSKNNDSYFIDDPKIAHDIKHIQTVKDAECNFCGWKGFLDDMDETNRRSGEVDRFCPECNSTDIEYL